MTARTTTATRNYDLTKVIKNEHAGKWIALSPNRTKVVAWANELSELEKLVGNRRVIYKKALRNDVSYAFKKTNF